MRRWLLCPFGVSHEEVANVSIRSKSSGGESEIIPCKLNYCVHSE